MIDQAEQTRIINTLKENKLTKGKLHAAFWGVCIGLGEKCPPAWTINLMCGRLDRIFSDK